MACLYPITLKDRDPSTGLQYQVPCRGCINCRTARQSELEFMSVMAQQQALSHNKGCSFLTLTYSDDFVRRSVDPYGNEVLTLRSSDCEMFHKRVRDWLKRKYPSLSNYQHLTIGEYGDRFDRPHIHALIFGVDADLMATASRCCWTEKSNKVKYPIGIVDCGSLVPGGIRYVVDYVVKQQTGVLAEQLYDAINIERPFLRHSTNLGTEFFFRHFSFDENFCYFKRGKSVPLPSYFRRKVDPCRIYIFNDNKGRDAALRAQLPYDVWKELQNVHNANMNVISNRLKYIPTFDVPNNYSAYVMSKISHIRSEQARYNQYKDFVDKFPDMYKSEFGVSLTDKQLNDMYVYAHKQFGFPNNYCA